MSNVDSALRGEPTPWFRRLLVGIEYGPTGANDGDDVYMAGASGKEIVENLVRANAEYGVIFCKDQNFAYYNSPSARKAPNLGSRDLLRECLDEAGKHGIAIVAYCQAQYDTSSWQSHPEWRMKDPEGADIYPRLCFNSGYVEQVKTFLDEMMAYHEIVGFHVDMLDFGFGAPYGCWCGTCRERFRERYDMEMPPGAVWDEAWDRMLQFRCDSNDRFCKELTGHVKSKRPELTIDFNYHGYPPFSWEVGEKPVQHAANGDFVTAEGLPWAFGNNSPSLLSLFMQAARPEVRVQAVTSRFVANYHDYTVRPVADMKWEVFTYLAHGAQCTIVDKANYEGSLDRLAYQRIGEVFREAREKTESFGHRPVQEVGLYYSARSRDWYGRDHGPKYNAGFSGAHKALMQSHITMGMIMDESLSLSRLQEFAVVYLPNAVILSDAEVELFKRYVSEGGRLLVTGLSSLGDSRGEVQGFCSLGELLGARLTGCITEHLDNYIRLPADLEGSAERVLADGVPGDWDMLTWGPIAVFETTTACGIGQLLSAHRSAKGVENVWEQLMSPKNAVGPAIIVNDHGKGKVVCVPACPDAAWAGQYRMPEHRNLIRNLVRYLDPNPPITITAPLNVEAVVTVDDSDRTLVHLVAFNAPAPSAASTFADGRKVYPPLMEEALQYEAQIRLSRPVRHASCQGGQVSLRDGQVILVTSNIHEVVTVEHS